MNDSEPARTAARRKLRPLAALAIVALIGAGCGTASSENGGSSDNDAADRQEAVTFAECMRENGVEEFPDPDASGELTIDGIVNGSSVDPSSAAWQNAIDACKGLQPPGFTGRKRSPEQQETALEFAQCIRDNGV